MDKADGAIVVTILVLVVQMVLAYVLASVNPFTEGGQRIAGIAFALDAVLLASVFSIYNRFFARTVYSSKSE